MKWKAVYLRNIHHLYIFNLNRCFWLKYESIIHKIAFSIEKGILSESGEKYAHIKHCLQAKTVLNKCGWILIWKEMHSFSLHKMLIDGLECCGLLVDYCDVFISCLDSHSDGIYCRWFVAEQVIYYVISQLFLYSCKIKSFYLHQFHSSVIGETWDKVDT